MPYLIQAKVREGGFSVVVETAKDALAKLAELAETDRVEVAAMDLSGTLIDVATLQADAGSMSELAKRKKRSGVRGRRSDAP